MAFNLFIGEEVASIEHYEEDIFDFATKDSRFPHLHEVFLKFYDDPRIEPHQSNELVHELITIRTEIVSNTNYKHIVFLIDRLLPFFSKAYKSNIPIKCESD